MPAKTIGLVPGIGIVGAIASSSPGEPYINGKLVKSTSAAITFGTGVMLNTDGTYSAVDGTTTATNFAGVCCQEFKQQLGYPYPANTVVNGTFVAGQIVDCCQRGELYVFARGAAPTDGGAVHLRILANGSLPLESVGEFRTAADGANTVLLTNATWGRAGADADGVSVIKVRGVNN